MAVNYQRNTYLRSFENSKKREKVEDEILKANDCETFNTSDCSDANSFNTKRSSFYPSTGVLLPVLHLYLLERFVIVTTTSFMVCRAL